VLLDEPKNEKWGSEAAAPMFSAIGAEALRYLHAPPKDTAPVQIVREQGEPQPEARRAIPIMGAERSEAGVSAVDDGPSAMPAVTGLSLRQAMQTLAPLDVRLEVAGRGVVSAQTPAAGAPLAPGMVARLTLHPPSARR